MTDLALLTQRLPRVTAAGSTMATVVGHLAVPVEVLEHDAPIARLERAFRSPHLARVAIRRGDEIGLLTRTRFHAALAGRLGFGRALLARRTVAQIADWRPLVAHPEASVLRVALAAMDREPERRFDDVLVSAADWRVASATELVLSLSTLLAVGSLNDGLTALANRAYLLHQLRERCAATAGTPHRVALVAIDVAGFRRINAELGHGAADGVLVAAAASLMRALPAGWDLGRTGDDEFTAVGSIPGPVDDERASAFLESVRRAIGPDVAGPGGAQIPLRRGVVCSAPGGGHPEALFHAVHERLDRLRHVPTARGRVDV